MALAVLKLKNSDGNRYRFSVDIGKNRFYTYTVGDKEIQRTAGLKLLRNRAFTSPLIGPLPSETMGRTTLEIPAFRLDKENCCVQVISYRTGSLEGPAISDIVHLDVTARSHGNDILPLLELSFIRSNTMNNSNPKAMVENIPFPYREAKYSGAMVTGLLASLLPALKSMVPAVTSMLPKVLPMLPDIIGGVVGGLKQASGPAVAPVPPPAPVPAVAPAVSPSTAVLSNPETIHMIIQLLKQVAEIQKGNGAAVSKSQSTPPMPRPPEYSTAATASAAVLAALPALMPLLEKVANPETIKAILQNIPLDKLIGTITNGIKDIAKLGIQSHEQDLKHLRAIHPDVDDPALDNLLAGMSLALSRKEKPDYRRVESVKMQFTTITPTMLYGRSRVAYLAGEDLSFNFQVETPRPTGKAVLTLTVKDPAKLTILVKQSFSLENVMSGLLPVDARLSAAQLSRLKPNEDYLVCAALVWKNKSGKNIGTSITQLITLVGRYSFDRVEDSGETIPLNDIHNHRDFWHKSWQGTFDSERKRIIFDCKYYFALEDRETNGRMETITQLENIGVNKETGRLKTGMILSPYVLNRLIPQISGHPPLAEDRLEALRSPDFIDRFNQAARTRVKLKGRPGSSAALWNYPEVKLQRVILKKVQEVDGSGHVTAFTEEAVYFPMPVLVHFIGAKSQ